MVALLKIELTPEDEAARRHRQHVATRLNLPENAVPVLHITWCPLRQGPRGDLVGRCATRPSDLEATIGVQVENKEPSKQERVLGYMHLKTTDIHEELGLELPGGTSTSPADVREGTACIAHRSKLAVPVHPGQVQVGDAANDSIANDEWLHQHGAIAVFDSNRRNEHVDEPSLVNRGYDLYGTP